MQLRFTLCHLTSSIQAPYLKRISTYIRSDLHLLLDWSLDLASGHLSSNLVWRKPPENIPTGFLLARDLSVCVTWQCFLSSIFLLDPPSHPRCVFLLQQVARIAPHPPFFFPLLVFPLQIALFSGVPFFHCKVKIFLRVFSGSSRSSSRARSRKRVTNFDREKNTLWDLYVFF